MYLVKELNKRKLFQRTSNFILNDNCRNLLPQIFYRASACLLSFTRISQYQHKCTEEFSFFDDQVNILNNRLLFISPTSISILNEITPILSSLRIMQNQFITLLSKHYRLQLPSSMNDYIKGINKYKVPDNIQEIITNYWKTSGCYLKNLRDIDQHFYHLIENSYMLINPEKKIIILFPDNPECKSPNNFKFENKIDGLKFLLNAFEKLNLLYEDFSKNIGYQEKDIIFAINFKHLIEKDIKKDRTLFMFYQEILQKIDNNHANLLITSLFFNQKMDGKVEMYETGLTDEKNQKLNDLLMKKKR